MPGYTPEPLDPAVTKPLLALAEQLHRRKPWLKFHDVNFIGTRDDHGELEVSSIMGRLGEVFGIITYRNPTGRSALYKTVYGEGPSLDALDYLKLEWVRKTELQPFELTALEKARFRTLAKGADWPRFETASPGLAPVGISAAEAPQFTRVLKHVLRMVELVDQVPSLYQRHFEPVIAVLPSADEPLTAKSIEWFPLVAPELPPPERLVFSEAETAEMRALPTAKGIVVECAVEVFPELSFMENERSRPALPWVGLIAVPNGPCISSGLVPATRPRAEALKQVLLRGVRTPHKKPSSVHFADEALFEIAREALKAVGIQARLVPSTPYVDELAEQLASDASSREPC